MPYQLSFGRILYTNWPFTPRRHIFRWLSYIQTYQAASTRANLPQKLMSTQSRHKANSVIVFRCSRRRLCKLLQSVASTFAYWLYSPRLFILDSCQADLEDWFIVHLSPRSILVSHLLESASGFSGRARLCDRACVRVKVQSSRRVTLPHRCPVTPPPPLAVRLFPLPPLWCPWWKVHNKKVSLLKRLSDMADVRADAWKAQWKASQRTMPTSSARPLDVERQADTDRCSILADR